MKVVVRSATGICQSVAVARLQRHGVSLTVGHDKRVRHSGGDEGMAVGRDAG